MMVFDIEERVAKAKRLFKEDGYNCCQAVVLAYNDVFGIDDAVAAAMSSGFGGGMGRMREVCGSVSGMVMLAGLIAPACDPSVKVEGESLLFGGRLGVNVDHDGAYSVTLGLFYQFVCRFEGAGEGLKIDGAEQVDDRY